MFWINYDIVKNNYDIITIINNFVISFIMIISSIKYFCI